MITAGEKTEFYGNIKLLETFFKTDGVIFALSARIQFPSKIHWKQNRVSSTVVAKLSKHQSKRP